MQANRREQRSQLTEEDKESERASDSNSTEGCESTLQDTELTEDNNNNNNNKESPMKQMATRSTANSTNVEQIVRSFQIGDEHLRRIKAAIRCEFELGLRDEENATIKMLVTYVRDLSRGDESGIYLALDLGGTHFRVLLVCLSPGQEPKVISTVHDIPAELLVTQNGQELFDYIALKLLQFVQQYKLKRRRISLGFTFSFPCKQYGLTQSILVKWCKGFNVGGVVGSDVVKQLKNALKRQLAGLVEAYIDVVAVINDTTGTLVACANKHRDCRIGLIMGTGFNVCYLERLDRLEKWPANYTNPKEVIINCEWGAMGDNKQRRELDKYRNEFDVIVDRESVNPQSQTYEKMVAGMYVGELLRLSLLKLHNARCLFTSNCDTDSKQTGATPRARQKPTVGFGGSNKPMRSRSASPRTSSGRGQRSKSKSANRNKRQSDSPSSPVGAKQTQAATECNQNKLNVKDILNGRHLSMLAKDELANSFDETHKIMKELNISSYTEQDMRAVIRVARAIMQRCADLVACGMSALLEQIQKPYTVIGYDGSVIKHHPYFLKCLVDKTKELTSAELKFELVRSSDGSGIGAAVVAAALHKERRPLYIVKPGKVYEMHYAKAQQSQLSPLDSANVQDQFPEQLAQGAQRATSPASSISSVSTDK